MFVKLYQSKTPTAIFSLPIIVSLIGLVLFFREIEIPGSPLRWQENITEAVFQIPWLNYVLTVVLISITANQINNAFNQHNFHSKNTFMPGFMYVMSILNLGAFHFSFDLIAHLFIAFGLIILFRIKRDEPAKNVMFRSSLLFGIASVLSPFSAVLFLLPLLTLVVFRPFVWREYLLTFLGFLLPIGYFIGIYFLIHGHLNIRIAQLNIQGTEAKFLLSEMTCLGIVGLFTLITIARYLGIQRTQVVRFKKQSQVLFHALWITLLVGLAGWYLMDEFFLGMTVILSMFYGVYILNAKNLTVVNIYLFLWFAVGLINFIHPL